MLDDLGRKNNEMGSVLLRLLTLPVQNYTSTVDAARSGKFWSARSDSSRQPINGDRF